MSCGSRAWLSRFSIFSCGIALSRELLSLTIDHFPCNQFILECGIAIGKTPPLLLPLLWGRLCGFGGFDELFEGFGHGRLYVPNRGFPPYYFETTCEPHTGKLSCLRGGSSTVLPRSIARARAMRGRVACGMITSSI